MKKLQQGLFIGLLFLLSTMAFANNGLTTLNIEPINDHQTNVALSFTHKITTTPVTFVMSNPDRVIVDFKNTGNQLKTQELLNNSNLIKNIEVISNHHRCRLIINLRKSATYTITKNNKKVQLNFKRSNNTNANVSRSQKNRISKLDFRTAEEPGSGKVILNLQHDNVQNKMIRQSDRLLITFENTTLTKSLAHKYNVKDFKSPAQTISLFQKGHNVQMVINTKGRYEEAAFQLNKQFIVELIPAKDNTFSGKNKYHGERVSLNFQKIPVRQVLQVLAEFTNANLIISNSVKGDISLRLDQVPWDQAMDIILKTQGLVQRKEGNVLVIAPATEILAQDKAQLQAQEEMSSLAALENETFHIKYGKAEIYYETLKDSDNTLLSSRGRIILNKRTNMLFIQDTPQKLSGIKHYIEQTDIPVKQVEIEARIVTVDKSFEREISITNPASADNPGGRGFNLDLGAGSIGTTAPGSIALATLSNDVLIGMELSALEAEGTGEILSSPRLLTADQQEAIIEQGTEIPYNESTSSGAAAIAFKKALLRLKVTPQITPDNKVLLKLEVNQDAKSKEASGTDQPIIDTRHITTNVLVNNGETVILGGIYERTKSNNVTRIPFISSIPIIGELFKHRSIVDSRKELLIFVTPRIVNQESD
jgi:type IV pilus assembly protein PilQ